MSAIRYTYVADKKETVAFWSSDQANLTNNVTYAVAAYGGLGGLTRQNVFCVPNDYLVTDLFFVIGTQISAGTVSANIFNQSNVEIISTTFDESELDSNPMGTLTALPQKYLCKSITPTLISRNDGLLCEITTRSNVVGGPDGFAVSLIGSQR